MSEQLTYPDREYPIVRWWYTSQRGKTIEETMKTNVNFFLWAMRTFQDITPSQARYFKGLYGREIPERYIRDVQPYEYVKGDPESLYCELCGSGDLDGVLRKYRVDEGLLF